MLHTCVTRDSSDSLAGLATGTSAQAQVDHNRRRKVAPNHTMTHVLNFALREVLGGGIEQKGSAVTHEKLRLAHISDVVQYFAIHQCDDLAAGALVQV